MCTSASPSNTSRLEAIVNAAASRSGLYRAKLSGIRAAADRWTPEVSIEARLDALPFTTKAELQNDQRSHPPFGSNLCEPVDRYVRFHRTSGTTGRPLVWLDTASSWTWVLRSWERIFGGMGISGSDRILFAFSFGPFLGFWSAFEGAMRRGCLCVPGGGLTTVARLEAIDEYGITVVAATPTYALRMAEVAAAEGVDLVNSSVRALIVAGEPGGNIPATRARLEDAWGARCLDHYGMTEVGPAGFECAESPGGIHLIEDEYLVEVIEPGSARRVPDGHEGELVLTPLGRIESPLIRYRTGDLVRWTRAPCPCGSPWGRLEGGILGRVDDMVYVRGNNVYPSAVESVLRSFAEIVEYRVRLRARGEMTELRVEVEPRAPASPSDEDDLGQRIRKAFERKLFFRPDVTIVAPGSLPRFELKARRWITEEAEPSARGAAGERSESTAG